MSEAAEDVRRVLTIVFRGVDGLPPHDLERNLSFDMEWVAPHEAETAVKALVKAGWLREENGLLAPTAPLGEVTVPFGWFPRPSRLLTPVAFGNHDQPQAVKPTANVPNETARSTSTPSTRSAREADPTPADPRAQLTKRVVRFVARRSGLDIEELHRRAQRKQAAFDLMTPWLAYALVAREQGLPMEEIVEALAVV